MMKVIIIIIIIFIVITVIIITKYGNSLTLFLDHIYQNVIIMTIFI